MPTSAQGVESKTGDLRPGEYFLAARGRKLCLYLGIFVAYSQLTSIGLLALSRYHVAWDGGRYFKADGYLNESFLVLSLIIPGGEIGLKSGSMMLFTLVAALILTPLGCAGLFLASCARKGRRFLKPALIGSFLVGLGVAAVVFCLQAAVAVLRHVGMKIDEPYEHFLMHGLLEAIGGTLVPALVYLTLLIWLAVQQIRISPNNRRATSYP